MIVPWLKGFMTWHKAPITWMLIVLNFFIFCLTFENPNKSSSKEFATVEMMVMTGKLYYQYQYPQEVRLPLYSQSQWMILGSQGLKDGQFVELAPVKSYFGDEIQIADWKTKMKNYQEQIGSRKSKLFGLHSENPSAWSWITYQFMHAGWMHLIGNMVMLLLFAAALESMVGALGLISIYILSGMVGGALFILLSENSLAPMIGASGSLSGVMAFYAAYEKKKRVSFFYFVSPMKGYYGWVYLPTLLLFPLCFLSDFAGYLSTPSEIGTGVAFACHIGGALFGASAGFVLRTARRSLWWQWLVQH